MKKVLLAAIVSIALFSCGKNGDTPSNEDIINKKIEDIIPAQYLDTLRILGLDVARGTNPPNVEGTYAVTPHLLDSSNVPGDPASIRFSDAKVTFSGQHNKDYSIQLIGEKLISTRDTSIATAISGSGNNFTVYGKVKSYNGSYYAVTAMVITGSKEGDQIKNFKIGIINIDNSHGGGLFIPEGRGRVGYDADFISEKQ